MKAMVLAAGLGTRLGALTAQKPKCLMQVGSTTILELVVQNLKRSGVTSLVINLHHFADQVRDYVQSKGNFGLPIEYSYEATPLETGGALTFARKLLEDEEFYLVHNADIYTDADLRSAIDFHRARRPLVSLLVMKRPTSRYLLFDAQASLVGWENPGEQKQRTVRAVSDPLRLAFSGISILSRDFFTVLEKYQDKFSVVPAWLDAAEQGLPVLGYRIDDAYWVDVGTPEQLEELRGHLTRK